MKILLVLLYITLSSLFLANAGIIYSFEDGLVPSVFKVQKGALSVSQMRSKLGNSALKWDWVSGDVMVASPLSLNTASTMTVGGINVWIYNEKASGEKLTMWFGEFEYSTTRSCQFEVNLNFEGWRRVYARFRSDMGHTGYTLRSMKWTAPASGSGTFWIDYLEFVDQITYELISDMQYTLNNVSKEMSDYRAVRLTPPPAPATTISSDQRNAIQLIQQRIEDWHQGTGEFIGDPSYDLRIDRMNNTYVRQAVNKTSELTLETMPDGTVRGQGLFPLSYHNSTVDGVAVKSFWSINEGFMVQLAYDFRRNNNTASRDLLLKMFDWYYDQGWADGSAMGILRFEKLRSSGFFHSAYMMRNEFSEQQFNRVMNAMNWYTLFGNVYVPFISVVPSVDADDLRSLLLPKLFYAITMKDELAQVTAMKALIKYTENAIMPAPGYLGTLKPDYSGYHHRGTYFNAYYPDALYAASLMAYLLSGTVYELNDESFENLKNALLTYGFLCAEYDVPAGLTGRFPTSTMVLHSLLPAYAYLALSKLTPDAELTAFFKKMWRPNGNPVRAFIASVKTDIMFANTPGEVEMMLRLASIPTEEADDFIGSKFLPYSGLLVSRAKPWVLSAKGFSKYIWDVELDNSNNPYGRYLSYGHVDLTMLNSRQRSFSPAHAEWDWSHLPGTTAKYLTKEQLHSQNNPSSATRNFSDEPFLGGIAFDDRSSVFANLLHDNTFDKSFYARKSIIQFDSVYTFLGSGIKNTDQNTFVHTTLFQNKKISIADVLKVNNATLSTGQTGLVKPIVRDNYGNGYVVSNGTVEVIFSNSFITAFIQHGKVMTNGSYAYHLVMQGTDEDLNELANSDASPVKIIRNDEKAQIVSHAASGATAAVVYDASESVNHQQLVRLNIPGIVMMKEVGDVLEVAITNPDMNRPSAVNITKLSLAQVSDPGTPMLFQVELKGLYRILALDQDVQVLVKDGFNTVLQIDNTRDGKTYRVKLGLSDTLVQQPNGEASNFNLQRVGQSSYTIHAEAGLNYTYYLYTADGKLVRKQECEGVTMLEAGALSPGLYLLNLTSEFANHCFRIIR